MVVRRLGQGEILPALRLVWEVFEQEVAPCSSEQGIKNFQNYIYYPNIQQTMLRSGLAVFGAFEQGQLCGVGAILPSGHITLMYVKREWQHRGAGKQLFLEMCTHVIREYRAARVTVHAVPGSAEAFRHMGMQEVAPEQNRDGMSFVPMEMWAGNIPVKKGRKKIAAAAAIGAGCLLTLITAAVGISREIEYLREGGSLGIQGQEDPFYDIYEEILPDYEEGYGSGNQTPGTQQEEEQGIGAIPEYVSGKADYKLKQDSYTYTADDTSTTTIQFEVYYPQVEGLEKAVQDRVNRALEDCALETVEKLYLHPSDEMKEKVLGEPYPVLASFVEYKVTYQGEDLLSVVFQDYCYEGNEQDAYVDLRGVNINLKDGTVYSVEDIVGLDGEFLSAWAAGMKDEADNPQFLAELSEEDMKAVLSGDSRDEVYRACFFVDEEGVEIGLSFRYPADSKENQGYAWVTAPFDFDEILPYQTGSEFWSLIEKES